MKRLRDNFTETSWDASTARVETPKPAGLQAWENYKASSFQRIVNPTNGLDAWKAYKLNSAIKAQQRQEAMTDIDYFDTDSVTGLGIGVVDYDRLKQLAYDGKIKISDPGDRQKFIVGWNEGWNASNYMHPSTTMGQQSFQTQSEKTAEATRGLIDAMLEQTKNHTNSVYNYLKPLTGVAPNTSNTAWYDILGGGIVQGGASVIDAFGSTLAAAENLLINKPIEWLTGVKTEGLFTNLQKSSHAEIEKFNQSYQNAVDKSGKVGQVVGKYLPSVVAALPQFVLAYLTGGASTATTATLQTGSAAAQASGTSALVLNIANTVKTFASNPSFQYSFISSFGNDYEQAKNDGANDSAAYLYALITSAANAAVEVGGGIEGLPEDPGPLLLRWAKSAVEEGGEEVVQGMIGQAMQNAIYNKGNALASLNDENAILSGKRAAEEFVGGAVVGGVLGGGNVAMEAIHNKVNGVPNNWIGNSQHDAQSGAEGISAVGDIQTQEQGEKPTTAENLGVAGVNVQADAEKTMQDRMIEAAVRAAQENNRQQAEAAKSKDDLTPAQKYAFDALFGRNKKAAPEVDTAEKADTSDLKQMQKDIEDAYAAGNMSEEEYDSALDALMEEESRVGVNTLDRYNPVMMEKTEVNDNGRSSISDGSGQRVAGTSAGEQAGELAEGTGGNKSRQVQSARARDRADAVARIYEAEQRQPVSGRYYLQSNYVEDAGQIYDVPKSVIDGDDELRTIASEARGMGMTVHFFSGEAKLVNGQNADAMIRDNDVYIRVDGDRWTATQNWEHEKFHRVVSAAKSVVQDLFTQFTAKTDGAKLHRTMAVYREAYHGICDVDENGNYVWDEDAAYRVVEEILADAYAGKDTFAQGVEKYSDATRDAASQIEERGVESRGPPDGFADGAKWSATSEYDPETSSIKEQLENSRELLNGMDIVAILEVPTNLKSKKEATKWAIELLAYTNYQVDTKDFGVIRFNKDDINDAMNYADTPEEKAAIAALPKVLKRGVEIGRHENHKGRNKQTVTIAAPVELNGQRGNMAVVISRYKNHYETHRIVLPDGSAFKFSDKKTDTTQEPSRGVTVSGSLAKTTSVVSDESVSQEHQSVKDTESFSASAADIQQDSIQALPKKAQRIIEGEESKLTNALGNALRIPFKSRSEQLKRIAREITNEFLQTGTVSERTLENLFEMAYRPNEQKLAEEFGVDVDEYRNNIERDFKAQVGNLTAQLRLANRYATDQETNGGTGSTSVPKLEDLPKLYADMKAARRMADKAVARNLLTESDNAKVHRLLRGDIDESMLNPLMDNVEGILEVYRAKEEYEKFAREIRRWNAQRKDGLRQLADKLLETAGEWKDKSAGLMYSRETMERNIRDIVKDKKIAEEIISTLFSPVHTSAAKATKMKNEYRDRVRALNLSRKVAKGNEISEAAAVQLLGEAEDNIRYLQKNKFMRERDGKTLEDWQGIVRDLWDNNPNLDAAKIRKGVNEFRAIYDELFEQMNDARMRNGYEPINYRKGYFPHFQSDSGDGILTQFGRSLGINTAAMQLPTTINGMTHTFKPGIQWFGSAQQRQGVNTSFDAVEGFDAYIEGVADVIHQTDNIQRLRAFATQVRYRTGDEGLRKQVDAVRNDLTIAEEDKQNRIKDIYENGKFELGNFAVELDEYTNLLAGKKSRHDRDMEQKLGRQMYSIMKALESRVAANMVAINPGSWLTNFIPITQGAATLDSASLLTGMWNTLRAIKQDDGMVAASSFLTNRRGSDPLVRTWAQETSAVLSKPMELIDSLTADTLVRARYNQNIKRGMSEAAAIAEADAWAAGVMADRSKGAMPTLFSQTNPVTKLVTQFQLEVNNQLSYVFKDIPRETREKGVAALAMAMLKFMIGAYFYNELYERFIGRRPALDPLGIINDTVGDLTGYELGNLLEDGLKIVEVEKKGLYDAGLNLGKAVAEELPFVGGLLGGGRLPISSALPDVGKLWQAATDDDWNARKRISTAVKELAKPAAYIAPPFGGGQVKKMAEGAIALARGGSYNVNSDGEDILQYPIHNDTFGQAGLNAITAMFFGKSALPGAREWVESGFNSLSDKETALFDSLRDNGAKSEEAYDLIRDLQELDTKLDKMVEIGSTHFVEPLKELAMSNQMSFSQYEKYMAARAAGVTTEEYTKLLKAISEEAKAQKFESQDGKPTTSQIETEMWSDDLTPDERRALWDSKGNLTDSYEELLKKYEGETEIGAGSVSQKVLKAVLKDSKLTRAQKRAIWNSYGWSTKSPW